MSKQAATALSGDQATNVISALKTVEYLTQRAKKAPSRAQFEKLLAKVPNREPEKRDKF